MMKKRVIRFDVLRILAMMFIVAHHIVVDDYGLLANLSSDNSSYSLSQLAVLITINAFCVIGVNLFFMISGYFGINLKIKKLLYLIFKIYVVYLSIVAVGIFTGMVYVDSRLIQSMINPIHTYWFMEVYIILSLCSGYLNKVADSMSENNYKKFAILSILIIGAYGMYKGNLIGVNYGYSLIMAITSYLLGAGIKRHDLFGKISTNSRIALFLFTGIITALIVFSLYYSGNNSYAWRVYNYNNPLIIIESILLISIFGKCQVCCQ